MAVALRIARAPTAAAIPLLLALCACGVTDPIVTTVKVDNSVASVDSIVRTSVRRPGSTHVLDFSVRVDVGQHENVENHGLTEGPYEIWATYLQGYVTRPQFMAVFALTIFDQNGRAETTRSGEASFIRPAPSYAGLSGSWLGSYRTGDGVTRTLDATFDGGGNVLAFSLSGIAPTSGAATNPGDAVYRLDLLDGRSLFAELDGTSTYLVLFEGDDAFGVLEKGALALGAHVQAELAGSFSGTRLEVAGAAPDLVELRPTNGRFLVTGAFGLTDDAGLRPTSTSNLLLTDAPHGLFEGAAGDAEIAPSPCRGLLSPDGEVLALAYGAGSAGDRAFFALRRLPP